MRQPLVTVLILATNEKKYLIDCVPSIVQQTYRNKKIYVVDNASSDGSSKWVRKEYPSVNLVRNADVLSYPEAYNRIVRKIKIGELFLLLNADTVADPRMLDELVKTYVSHQKENIGLVQPVILLKDHPGLINTIGNAIHFLGFGYCRNYQARYQKFENDRKILSASGAALLVSRSFFQKVGAFDEEFVRYCEDQNLSWRGLLQGYAHYVSCRSILYHQYDFSRRRDKIYHAEKNRIMMFIENYSIKTIVLLSPLLFINEAMVIFYALLNGWFMQKMKSYLFIIFHWRLIMVKRRETQKRRTVSDKSLFASFDAEIQSPLLKGFLIDHVVNPLFRFYFAFLATII